MKKKSFTYNTLIMSAANIITRLTGFAYRIFLSRFIGAEGLGVFALISPIYSICCSIVASGLPVASMKDVSECVAKGDKKGAKTTTLASLFLVFIVSSILFLLLILSAPYLSFVLGDARTLPSVYILSLSVLITGFENIYKSSFYADGLVKFPAITEIAEQMFRIITVVLMVLFYAKGDITRSSAVLTFGIFAGEALSLTILFISYKRTTKKIPRLPIRKSILPLLNTAVPVTASKTAETLLGSASNILIPAMLVMYGFSRNEATEVLGVISGMVMPLLFLPSVFTNALSVNLVPFISANLAKGNKAAVKRKLEKVLTVTAFFTFPAFFCLAVFSEPISECLFSDSRVALFLPLMSIGAIFATFRHIFTSVLNAASMAKKASFYSFTGNALQLLLTAISIPFLGITGYIASYIISNILLFIPTSVSVFSVIPSERGLSKKLLPSLSFALLSFGAALPLYNEAEKTLPPLLSMIISATAGSFVYLLMQFFSLKNKKIIFLSKKLD